MHAFKASLRRQRQADSECEGSLTFKARSRTVRVFTQRNLVLLKKKSMKKSTRTKQNPTTTATTKNKTKPFSCLSFLLYTC